MTDNQAMMGIKIMMFLVVPISIVYCIRWMLTPVKQVRKPQVIFLLMAPHMLMPYKPKTLRLCNFHLTLLPKGRIALVVDKIKCDTCEREKYAPPRV